ncbi:MAG: BREX-3 system phosphatase PglZ [Anaerolineales bacterium]
MAMLEQLLSYFPAHTHPLTLVSDPDGLLGEAARVALAGRGFTLVQERDPVALRHAVEQARPWSPEHPLIVLTAGPLNALPYDLWQQGHHVRLSLHALFPHLAYPVIKALAPAQRERLAQAPPPARRLSRGATLDYVLRHVFDAVPSSLRRPANLLAWLAAHHERGERLPPEVEAHLLEQLGEGERGRLAGWPLAELLGEPAALDTFVQDQWQGYVRRVTGGQVDEPPLGYRLDFAADPGLQGLVPALVGAGTLVPVTVERPSALPPWARPALLAPEEEDAQRGRQERVQALEGALRDLSPDTRWESWQRVARLWAELTALHYGSETLPTPEEERAYTRLRGALDERFVPWLAANYAALATSMVPRPHHLYHVPHYLAFHHPVERGERVALLVVDGLALADWVRVGAAWRLRHPDWRISEALLLAQIPTLTSVSRQALVSGLRPQAFAETLDESAAEASRWPAFWQQQGLPESACPYLRLRLDREEAPAALYSARTLRPCAIESGIDALIHEAGMGLRHFFASLEVWLEDHGRRLERVIEALLAKGYTFYLTSDHGHTEAVGMGTPSEGILSRTRSKRARLYDDRGLAERTHTAFPETLLWEPQGLLPEGVYALVAQGRRAFTTADKIIVSHGGLSLDEIVVPFVSITR